ncbi:MAG: hypothetical protein ABR518_05910, partial [Actinomycetota bacterium]
MTAGSLIEVWRQPDGFWRWRYRDDGGVDLLSNTSHISKDEAVHAASVAYPGVPMIERHPPEWEGGLGLGRTAARGGIALAAVAAGAVVAVPVVVGVM